ncbi:phage protease [Paracoccus aminovorans]|uniref:phage protease n=1 Tax=Paracoccus aminovorans TaxID=34004 RepID=UPI0007854D20|nr:phage protease [Paracoccus aminovorans]
MSKRSILQSMPLALCSEEGAVPDWVQLTPQGPYLSSRDGREWQLPDPDAVVRAYADSLAAGIEAPVDFEHATHVKGERGERADAVGWVKELANRDGALWGRIDWTETGRAAVASRGYRYVSPGFFFSAATRAVARLASVGLTNLPNFALPALNREHPETENDPMDPAVLEALGLKPTATPADAVLAINGLKSAEQLALNRAATPDPEKFVPKADHQLALNRIADFEAGEKTRAEKAATDAVDAAIAAGKIAPASRDYHLATCRAEGGLERFQAFVAAQPVIAAPSNLDKKPGTQPGALGADELAVCRQFGMSPEEFAAARAAEGKE